AYGLFQDASRIPIAHAIEKSNSIRMTPPSSPIQMRRVRTTQESYYFAITNVHVIRGPFAFQPNKKPRPACAERGFSYRDPAARRRYALQPRRRAQGVDLVGLFPAEGGEGVGDDGLLLRDAAEGAVGRGFLVHGVQQVEHAGDGVGAQVEHFAHQVDDGGFRHLVGAEGVQGDRGGLGHADGVGHLDLAAVGQAGGDDVLGHVAAGVGGGAVHLGRVLAGEGAAAVAGHAAVGVDDDLAAGQAAVAHRAADDELAGRVDVELGVLVQQFGRQGVLDDQLHDRFLQVILADFRVVLRGQHHGVDAHHLAAFIAAGDLALGVRAQPRQQAGLAGLGLALDQAVAEHDGRGHQHVGLVAGVAEHQALVAGALVLRLGAVHALGDVHGLLADDVDDTAGGAVEADFGAGVADVADHVADDLLQVDPGAGGHFTGDDGHAGLDQGFHRHAGVLVLGDHGVQHGIGDLVGDLVGMAFGDGFRGENRVFAHLFIPVSGL